MYKPDEWMMWSVRRAEAHTMGKPDDGFGWGDTSVLGFNFFPDDLYSNGNVDLDEYRLKKVEHDEEKTSYTLYIVPVYDYATFEEKEKAVEDAELDDCIREQWDIVGECLRDGTLASEESEIRFLRKKYKLSVKKFSELTGIPTKTINNWEAAFDSCSNRKPPKYLIDLVRFFLENQK